MFNLFDKDVYKKAHEIEKSISEEVRDDSFIKVMDSGTVNTQENRALKLMYGENQTNHELSKKLNIPLASATRTTCRMRKAGYLFNISKVYNEETETHNTMMALTTLGKKRGQNLLWQDFQSKKVGVK